LNIVPTIVNAIRFTIIFVRKEIFFIFVLMSNRNVD
jgi:hypothetical protein